MVNQRLAIILLRQQSHRVVVAGDGKQAVAAWEQQPFDAILMDVQMPEMDGFEATARIRAREQGTGRHVPIIAMTAHAMKGDRERCLQAGMDAYVAKPIQAAELYQALANLTSQGLPGKPNVPEEKPLPEELDRPAILERIGGDEEDLRQLAAMFMEESAELLQQIRAAVADKQGPLLRRAAHSLKGAVGIFGGDGVFRAAQKLEEIGRTNNLTEAEEVADVLERELDRLRPAFAKLTAPSC